MLDNVSNKAQMAASFFALGAATIALKKGFGAIDSRYSLIQGGHLSGAAGAGLCGGFATAISYHASPLIAKHATNKDDVLGAYFVRVFTIAVSTFISTALFSNNIAQMFTPNKISLSGRVSYAALATGANLFHVTVGTEYNPAAHSFSRLDKHNAKDIYSYQTEISRVKFLDSAKVGLVTGMITSIIAVASYVGMKGVIDLGNTFPVIKGTVPTAITMGTSYLLSRSALDYCKVFEESNCKQNVKIKKKTKVSKKSNYNQSAEKTEALRWLSSVIVATICGIGLTPTLSSMMLKNRVSYGAAAGFSVTPFVCLEVLIKYKIF